MWIQSLDQEDPLEKGMATHSSILAWRILQTEEPGRYSPWVHKELDMTERLTPGYSTSCQKPMLRWGFFCKWPVKETLPGQARERAGEIGWGRGRRQVRASDPAGELWRVNNASELFPLSVIELSFQTPPSISYWWRLALRQEGQKLLGISDSLPTWEKSTIAWGQSSKNSQVEAVGRQNSHQTWLKESKGFWQRITGVPLTLNTIRMFPP